MNSNVELKQLPLIQWKNDEVSLFNANLALKIESYL